MKSKWKPKKEKSKKNRSKEKESDKTMKNLWKKKESRWLRS